MFEHRIQVTQDQGRLSIVSCVLSEVPSPSVSYNTSKSLKALEVVYLGPGSRRSQRHKLTT